MGQTAVIVLRLAHGVQQHFSARRSEWALAFGMTGWGYVVSKPASLFTTSPAYSAMANMAAEPTWGYSAFGLGLLRVLALIINGTFPGTIYANHSPFVRGVAAYLSCFLWAAITLGLFATPSDAPGAFIYLVLFGLDFANGYTAMHDYGLLRGARKNADPA
jgi:hypothetical protein